MTTAAMATAVTVHTHPRFLVSTRPCNNFSEAREELASKQIGRALNEPRAKLGEFARHVRVHVIGELCTAAVRDELDAGAALRVSHAASGAAA